MKDDAKKVFTNSDELISFLTKLAVNRNYVFRGYGRQSELLPNLIREKDWSSEEINLLHEFERYGLQYFSANSPIDFMSYAQHYGLPTRLLDFTFNPFIALSFALFMPKSTNYTCEEDKTYYYIRYCNLNDQIYTRTLPYFDDQTLYQSTSFSSQCGKMIYLLKRIICGLGEPVDDKHAGEKAIVQYFKKIYSEDYPGSLNINVSEFRPFLNDFISKFEDKRILFIDPNQCNQRIVMQQGLFMFPYTLDAKEHVAILEKQTKVLLIHKDLRDELIDYLDTIGLNAFRLMPDLQSVCQTVKRRVIELRQQRSSLFKKKLYSDNYELEKVHALLSDGFARYKREDGYANIAPVGAYIKRNNPQFNISNYGFSKLSDFISSFPDKYEITKVSEGSSVPIALYRCIQ